MNSLWVITGSGKGKTTWALGLLVRNALEGRKGAMVQFMKGYPYSEVTFFSGNPMIRIFQTGTPCFVKKGDPLPVDMDEARRGLAIWNSLLDSGECTIIVLDEINVAINYGLLSMEEVLPLIERSKVEVLTVFTGREPPEPVKFLAGRIMDVREISHPFNKGILARKGIDY
ncbi:MAG: cob(I)yrinic acid a,c-diamide adenosyltransferase [Synergistales bacterium]|nr:cob(I)yrinic acid a,c-diamide adenosyltransferase [Synergistales bacterium]